jgi:hypothetical protein
LMICYPGTQLFFPHHLQVATRREKSSCVGWNYQMVVVVQ